MAQCIVQSAVYESITNEKTTVVLACRETDEYIDYCFGKVKKNKPSPSKSLVSEKPYRRETPNHPSLSNNIGGIAPRKEVPVYTGNAVIGQAYNKGGLQVLSAEEAKDPTTGKRR